MQAQPKDYCLRSERPPASPQPAAAVVEAWLSDAVVSLPFDQDPGTAERFTELWAKAFQEVSSLLVLVCLGMSWLSGKPPCDSSGFAYLHCCRLTASRLAEACCATMC